MPAARIQPQGRARVNTRHPLARNLVGAFIPGLGRDIEIVTGAKFGTFGTRPTLVTGQPGLGWQPGSYTLPIAMSPIFGPAKVTVIMLIQRTGTIGTYRCVMSCGGESTSSGGWDVEGLSDTLNFTSWNNGAPTNGTSVSLPLNAISVLGFTNDGSTTRSYLNGVGVGSNSGPMNAATTGGAGPISIGTNRTGGNATPNCINYGVLIFNRVLSDAEMANISANPWQVLDGQAPMLYAASAPAILLAMSEAASASDGSSATVISAAAAAEAAAATDASQAVKATPVATAEVGAGIDATSGASSAIATNVETLAGSDSTSTGATTSAATAESGAASDSTSALNAALASNAEAGTATDSSSAVTALAKGSADAMSAADACSTSVAATSVSTAEAGSAADATSGVQLSVAATSEGGAVSDNPAATMATTAGRSDALTAADLQQPGGTIISASVAESGAVADFVLASYMLAAQVTEGASASDWLACSFMGLASISEASPAIDITSGRWITSAAVAEALAALEQTTAQLGGQLKPNPRMTYVGRPRIRSITGATRIRRM